MKIKGVFAGYSEYGKFLIVTGIVLIGAVLFTSIGTAIAGVMYGTDVLSAITDVNRQGHAATYGALMIIQAFSSAGTFILAPLFAAFLFSEDALNFLSIKRKISFLSVIVSFLILIVSIPVINMLLQWNSELHLPSALSSVEKWMRDSENSAAAITEIFTQQTSVSALLLNLFIIALLPAVGEELLFRGIIQRLFIGLLKNKHSAVWVSAVLFSAMHMQFFGFFPRMILGAFLGYLCLWSGNIKYAMLAHFFNNAGTVFFEWIIQTRHLGISQETIGTGDALTWTLPISVTLSVILIWLEWRIFKKDFLYTN